MTQYAATLTPTASHGVVHLTIHVAGQYDRRITSTPDAAEEFAHAVLRAADEARSQMCKTPSPSPQSPAPSRSTSPE